MKSLAFASPGQASSRQRFCLLCVGFALCAVASSRPTTSDWALIGAVFVTEAGMMSGEVEDGDVWDVLYA